ncbi:hypothetical protein GCM10010442_67670 [Kitasatospora kifunensis]
MAIATAAVPVVAVTLRPSRAPRAPAAQPRRPGARPVLAAPVLAVLAPAADRRVGSDVSDPSLERPERSLR